MFKRAGSCWHIFPEQTQARRAIWNGVDGQGRWIIDQVFPPPLRRRVSTQELLIETVNGSVWQMGGSDNYDSLVGSNPVGVVFSEWELAKPEAWDYICPILVENDGWALFIFTPRGRNHAWGTWMQALESEAWFCERLTVADIGLIRPEQIEAERQAGMSEGKIRQEFHCSFEAENDDQLISYALLEAAMRRERPPQPFGEKVIGVDVARLGDDKSVIWFRQGRDGAPVPHERHVGLDTMELAARVARWIQLWHPARSSSMTAASAAVWLTGCTSSAAARCAGSTSVPAPTPPAPVSAPSTSAPRCGLPPATGSPEAISPKTTASPLNSARRCTATTPATR